MPTRVTLQKLKPPARKGVLAYEEHIARNEMREEWMNLIRSKSRAIFEAQLAAALGHWKESEDGTRRVYMKSPDPAAIHWILEQVWGKARQGIDIDAKVDMKDKIPEESRRAAVEVLAAWGFTLPQDAAKQDDERQPAGDGGQEPAA